MMCLGLMRPIFPVEFQLIVDKITSSSLSVWLVIQQDTYGATQIDFHTYLY